MTKRTYYTIALTGIAVAFLLDCATGQPLLSGPIALLFMGFSLALQIAYHVTNRKRPTSQGQARRRG